MLRKMVIVLLCLSVGFAMVPAALAEKTVIRAYCCMGKSWPGCKQFLSVHPDVTIEHNTDFVDSTSELVGQLVTKQFNFDVMSLSSMQINPHILMEKGYYLDLSQSETICQAVESMYPAFQQAATYDGKLYAFPYGVGFHFMQIDPDDWREAGYTDDDIPQSYEELLQFLEGLCERLENDPDLPIHMYMFFNALGDYDASDYTLFLTQLFLEDYIMQQQMAGKILSFDDEELEALLEKTKTVCSRLFAAERYLPPDEENTGLSLITNGTQMLWAEDEKYVLFFRMNESQPRVVATRLELLSIFAGTQSPDLCLEMLESVVNHGDGSTYDEHSKAFLYQNATPIVSRYAEANRIPYQNTVTYITHELARDDLEPLERRDLEEKLGSSRKVRLKQTKVAKRA